MGESLSSTGDFHVTNRPSVSLTSRMVTLRPMAREDVPFLYRIRRSEGGKWLNPTAPDILDQYRYFDQYVERYNRCDEIYFVIRENRQSRDVGVTRITNLLSESRFGWEGLIVEPSAAPGSAIDSILAIYSLGFTGLQKKVCGPWRVKKQNIRVNGLHTKMGIASRIGEDDACFIYEVYVDRFLSRIDEFKRRGFGHVTWPEILDIKNQTCQVSPFKVD